MDCNKAVERLLPAAGLPVPLKRPAFVQGVSVSGVISVSLPAQPKRGVEPPPRPGFGHLGGFPGQIDATALDLDNAKVVAAGPAR